ncbi:MAG: hypothetical protein JWP15_3617 [Alphaproteobacteria bacterium]|nr:hypothetical protein [Alphaproteobacteria bacterium]
MVARHRVEGLAHNALAAAKISAPADLLAWLAGASSQTARENLVFAAESMRLAKAFEQAGIPFLFVKGVTLSVLAYRSLAFKRACDIDLAVDPDLYVEAAELLRRTGLQCLSPGPSASADEMLAWTARNKHTVWVGRGVAVELHSALVDTPLLLSKVSIHSPRQAVEIGPGMALPTLAPDELFAYLCVHGATHAWSRIKWLADVAALLAHESPETIERLYRRSLELGAGRTSGQALLLSAQLLGLALPEGLERELSSNRAVAYLARVALRSMLRGGGIVELDDMALGTADIHLSHFRLMPGFRFKWSEARRKLAGPADDEPLPGFLQPILAAPRWLLRRARRSRGAA